MKIRLVMASVICLAACDDGVVGKVSAVSQGRASTVELQGYDGNRHFIGIEEVCYDGVVYLVTTKGGISPKITKEPGGTRYLSCKVVTQ